MMRKKKTKKEKMSSSTMKDEKARIAEYNRKFKAMHAKIADIEKRIDDEEAALEFAAFDGLDQFLHIVGAARLFDGCLGVFEARRHAT